MSACVMLFPLIYQLDAVKTAVGKLICLFTVCDSNPILKISNITGQDVSFLFSFFTCCYSCGRFAILIYLISYFSESPL